MKTIYATKEISMFDMQKCGLNAFREAVQETLMLQIRDELMRHFMEFVVIEQALDHMEGVMKVRASLRIYEKSDGQSYRFIPLDEEMKMRVQI